MRIREELTTGSPQTNHERLISNQSMGITSADAQLAECRYRCDRIEFPPARSISPELANEIAEAVRDEIQIVGLFVNHTKEAIEKFYEKVQFDLQLHGDEDPFFLKQLRALDSLANVRLIKAFKLQDSDLLSWLIAQRPVPL